MAKALCFLIFAAFAWQVRGLELESVKNALHNIFGESEEAEVQRFKCDKDGMYVNPRNCSTFIQCSNGISHLMPCPSKLHFSNKTQRCESHCDAQCDRSLACRCKWPTCVKEVCFLPPKIGPCRDKIRSFYYNKRQSACIPFMYGGCKGNENNFPSKEDCLKQCENAIDICRLPSEPGPCHGSIPRYFFNTKTEQCEKFIYGGCKGNQNSFETKEICEKRCPKKQEEEEVKIDFKCPKDGMYPNKLNCSTFIQCTNGRPIVMPCPSGLHFSVKTQRCEQRCDAHCDRTLACKCDWKSCETKLTCFLPKEPGKCRGFFSRFYFNKKTGICELFTYGGCEGNENNFVTIQDCRKTCGKAIDICKLPSEAGPCHGSFERYFFNTKTEKCEKFIYGGCNPNANNFETQEKCEKRCLKKHGEEEEEAIDFKCYKDGLFPNKLNCSTFIQCTNGRPIVMPCPSGLHFSVKAQRCESPCEAHCERALACKCEWKTCGSKESCKLPFVTGTCKANIPRFYFDSKSGLCRKFTYGGCNGNENNFERQEDCEKYCGSTIDICTLPQEVGPCRALIPAWWYNAKTKKCEQFKYGGCEGNANNFRTKEDCENKCAKKLGEEESEIEVFKCPKDGLYPNKLNCSSYIQCTNGRPIVMPCPSGLHFSVKTQRCEQRCDAHCDRTLACKCQWKTCETKLACFLPKQPGKCRGHFPRYYFDKRTGICKIFIFGGCEGNENNFEYIDLCKKTCDKAIDICRLPSVTGPCKAAFQRWYYNKKTKKCEKFTYGGCQGNANNFKTAEECEQRCPQKPGADGVVVRGPDFECGKDGLHPFKSNCSAFIQCSNGRPIIMPCPSGLHFSIKTLRCEQRCEAHCDKTLACQCKWKTCSKESCLLSPETGSCKEYKPRYYFSKTDGLCKPFIYSGCRGNENNFATKEDCQKFCGNSINICRLPSETGNCDARKQRFFFNSKTGKCEKFIYGGCGGNANNFLNEKECNIKCLRKSAGEEEEEGPIRCIMNGIYPDPDDCTQYIHCFTNNTNIVYKCPAEQHYSVSLKRCEPICNAYCDPKLACECKWPNCKKARSAVPKLCTLPVEKGTCHAEIQKYYFDSEEGECKNFTYGGCGGNMNSFYTKELCEKTCKRSEGASSSEESSSEESAEEKPVPECKSKPDVGNCFARLTRWYYDETRGKCYTFRYGGCGGNGNNYETEEDCQKYCSKH